MQKQKKTVCAHVCKRARERETMNWSSSGSEPKRVEPAARVVVVLLQRSLSLRISSNTSAISGGAPTCKKDIETTTNKKASKYNQISNNSRNICTVCLFVQLLNCLQFFITVK
jgi:hypothetical protein